MHERDLEPEHPLSRRRVDQLRTRLGELPERRLDVVDLVGDVVHAGPPLRQETADRRVLPERGEQLDPALAEPQRRRLDALVVDPLAVLDPATEQMLVRADGVVEVGDGHAHVMDPPCLHRRDATAISVILASMGRRSLVAALLLLALAGCGGGSKSNGEAGKPAAKVVADAQHAAASASSVHISGHIVDNGTRVAIDLLLVKGKGGKGTMSGGGVSLQLVRVGNTAYVKGSDAFLRSVAGASVAEALHGRWLKAPATTGPFAALTQLTDSRKLFGSALGQHGKLANRGETTYQGQKVVEIDDTTEGGTLYVAAQGTPYPVALTGSKQQGSLRFDRWGEAASIVAPKGAVDLSRLTK